MKAYQLMWQPLDLDPLPEWPASITETVSIQYGDCGLEVTVWTVDGAEIDVWRSDFGKELSLQHWDSEAVEASFGTSLEQVETFLFALFEMVCTNIADAESKALDLIRDDLVKTVSDQRQSTVVPTIQAPQHEEEW